MPKARKKNPWVAAILNFVLYGLGYIYLGKKKVLALGLITSDILLTVILLFVGIDVVALGLLTIPFSIMGLALANDAYKEAK